MSEDFQPGTPGVYDGSVFNVFVATIASEDEQNHTMMLIYNLLNLNDLVNDYAAAISLHLHVRDMRNENLGERGTRANTDRKHILKIWDEMAGREAAMIVYHVADAIKAIQNLLKDTPTIRAFTDSASIREATKALARGFPNHGIARNAVAHRGDGARSFEIVMRNGVKEEGRTRYVAGVIDGDDYHATLQGKDLRVSLTGDARSKLNDVVSKVYAAFPEFADKLPPLNSGSRS